MHTYCYRTNVSPLTKHR